MADLVEFAEQFATYQRKQRGKTRGGVTTYRWNLEQFFKFVRRSERRPARLRDLEPSTIQSWMDDMASKDLATDTMRSRQSTLSSFCSWLVKRGLLAANPIATLDRPPHRRQAPRQIPGPELMDRLVDAARARGRVRDVAIFLILRFTGMRRESVATLRVRTFDPTWGLRAVSVKGGRTRDIPLPEAVRQFLREYIETGLQQHQLAIAGEAPLFWSTWGSARAARCEHR